MIITLIFLVFLCFFFVLLYGAPYLPSLKSQIDNAFELGKLKKGQTILELGCGDGKVLIAAAKKDLNAVGYEINPILFIIAWCRTIRYRSKVKVIWGDYWNKDWPEADVIFVFLIQRYMQKLHKKCIQYQYKPVKLLSFAFTVPDKKAVATKGGIFLYEYR